MSKPKSNSVSKSHDISMQGQSSFAGLFARLFWSLFGNVILFFLILGMFKQDSLLSYFDLFYWITVFVLIAIRYCDIRYLHGITTMGLQATMDHWRKYAGRLVFITAILWFAVKAVGFTIK